MKMTNIFGKNGSLLIAGALAFTFASCDTDTRSNQSTQREAENMYETETNEGANINDPSVTYQEGEYQTTEADNYDYNREYSYEERDVVVERVKNDLERAEQSLKQLEQRASDENGDIKGDLADIREDIQKNREELSNKLEELETSTQDNWENVRNETNESLRGFERDWDELRNRGINNEVSPETENNMESSEDVRGVAPGTGTRDGDGF